MVYEELTMEILKTSNRSTRQNMKFPLEKIYNVSHAAHDKLKVITGECNPTLRAFPIACSPFIDDKDLFQISCDEARFTHFSAVARQPSGLVNLICRHLTKGDDWDTAVNNAFSTVPNLLGSTREIKDRYKCSTTFNSHERPLYAPHVLHLALYCVTNTNSFQSALHLVHEIDNVFCPTLIGILADARWTDPISIETNSDKDILDQIYRTATYLSDDWQKQLSLTNTSVEKKSSFVSKLFSF